MIFPCICWGSLEMTGLREEKGQMDFETGGTVMTYFSGERAMTVYTTSIIRMK